MLPGFLNLRRLLYSLILLDQMNRSEKVTISRGENIIWNNQSIKVLMILLCIGNILDANLAFRPDDNLFYVMIIALFITVAVLFYYSAIWFLFLYSSSMHVSQHEVVCTIHNVALWIMLIGGWLIYFTYGGEKWSGYNDDFFICDSYFFTLFVMFIVGLNSYISRRSVTVSGQVLDMKRMLMRYVSHEIRTPLGVIVGGLDLLLLDLRERASVEVGAIDDAINDLRYSCDIATGILDELLLLEQLEGGIMKLKLEKLEVRKVIEDAIRPLPFQVMQSPASRKT